MRDPSSPDRLRKDCQIGDWLHPNPKGYKMMGEYAAERLEEMNVPTPSSQTTIDRKEVITSTSIDSYTIMSIILTENENLL